MARCSGTTSPVIPAKAGIHGFGAKPRGGQPVSWPRWRSLLPRGGFWANLAYRNQGPSQNAAPARCHPAPAPTPACSGSQPAVLPLATLCTAKKPRCARPRCRASGWTALRSPTPNLRVLCRPPAMSRPQSGQSTPGCILACRPPCSNPARWSSSTPLSCATVAIHANGGSTCPAPTGATPAGPAAASPGATPTRWWPSPWPTPRPMPVGPGAACPPSANGNGPQAAARPPPCQPRHQQPPAQRPRNQPRPTPGRAFSH